MKIFTHTLTLLLIAAITSCTQNGKPAIKEDTGLIKGLAGLDSAEVIFYKDPYGDSLRYTRFFTFTTLKDSATLKTISAALADTSYTIKAGQPACRSEGKIILHLSADVFKTVYFSTKCDSCCYLYVINEGQFANFPLPGGVRTVLENAKPLAKEPMAENPE